MSNAASDILTLLTFTLIFVYINMFYTIIIIENLKLMMLALKFLMVLMSCWVPTSMPKATQVIASKDSSNKVWRLDSFNKELFWEEPAEGILFAYVKLSLQDYTKLMQVCEPVKGNRVIN